MGPDRTTTRPRLTLAYTFACTALVLGCLASVLRAGPAAAQPGATAPDPAQTPPAAADTTAMASEGAGAETDRSMIAFMPPGAVEAMDLPNDPGHGIRVRWQLSPDDERILGYEIWRAPEPRAPSDQWVRVGVAPRGTTEFDYEGEEPEVGGVSNPLYLEPDQPAFVAVRAIGAGGGISPWSATVSATPTGNWFHTGKANVLVALLLFGGLTVWFIREARRGRQLYIRPIPGINAVDEAIGRATEMGRPILFVLGTGTAGDIATIAGYTILARVAKRTAEYQTPIMVPVNDPVMMAMAQETVKEAYLQAGRPDVYNPESIFYISAMQFPYVAAVNGLMLRERTATNFYMGVFHAESLLLAEAGSITGAIQISGTDQVSQIPFFVAATDYTLIGEELYAASAYLSQEPVLLGPLKAQDFAKVVILVLIIAGVVLSWAFGNEAIRDLVHTA